MPWIRGNNLTDRQRTQTLAAFAHRWTQENRARAMRAVGFAESAPTIEPATDEEWLRTHAFRFVADGSRLHAGVRYCIPAYMMEEENRSG